MSSMHQPYGNGLPSDNPANEPILHSIDFEDVDLSPTGLQILQIGGQAAIRHHMPMMNTDNLTPHQVMLMFIDKVFWEEHSGGLIMCSDMVQSSLCLPIPKGHWNVRMDGKTVQ